MLHARLASEPPSNLGGGAAGGVLLEPNGLRVPAAFDCDLFYSPPDASSRAFWPGRGHHYFYEAPSRWYACWQHHAALKSGLKVAAPRLPLIDDEYATHIALHQSVLRASRARPFVALEVGARWGTWGSRAVAFLRSVRAGAAYTVHFVERDSRACDGIRQVMELNRMAYSLDCAAASVHGLSAWIQSVSHVDLLHMDVQGDESALLPALLPLLHAKVYRVIIRTHSVSAHGSIRSLFLRSSRSLLRGSLDPWIVIEDVPRQINSGCVWKYVRGNYKPDSPDRFNWRSLLAEGCYHNTSRGPVAHSDGELILDNPRFVNLSRALSLGGGAMRLDDLLQHPSNASLPPLLPEPRADVSAMFAHVLDSFAPAASHSMQPQGAAVSRARQPAGRVPSHHNLSALAREVAQLAAATASARKRFVFTISTRETAHWVLNLGSSAWRHGGVRVGVVTFDRGLCSELELLGIHCFSADVAALSASPASPQPGGGSSPQGSSPQGSSPQGSDPLPVSATGGYALTYVKFDVMRLAIEAGYSPTFIDADVMITSDLTAALDSLSAHDLYLANGKGPRCGGTIDGFMHCGRSCVPSGATWRIMARVASRRLEFAQQGGAFWDETDRMGFTAPPHAPKPFRENLLLNDVLTSECCLTSCYALAQPATATLLQPDEVEHWLGASLGAGEGCSTMGTDSEGTHFRTLPQGGTLAYAAPTVLGNFQGSFLRPPAARSRVFSSVPPPLAHFVGATPYKTQYMQAYGFWNFSLDAAAHRLLAGLGLHGQGRSEGGLGDSRSEKRSRMERAGWQSYSRETTTEFNGLTSRTDMYFSQAPRTTKVEQNRLQLKAVWRVCEGSLLYFSLPVRAPVSEFASSGLW